MIQHQQTQNVSNTKFKYEVNQVQVGIRLNQLQATIPWQWALSKMTKHSSDFMFNTQLL